MLSEEESDLDVCLRFIVTVPTPADSANRPDSSPWVTAFEMARRRLKVSDVVSYETTVCSGATDEIWVPAFELESGK